MEWAALADLRSIVREGHGRLASLVSITMLSLQQGRSGYRDTAVCE